MADQEVVIVDKDGNDHVFPAGFDPQKAAAIVRQQLGVVEPTQSERQAELVVANAKPIEEPTTWMGGATKHLLTKEPGTVAALGTLGAMAAGPAGLPAAGVRAATALAPLASDAIQRGSKYIYGQQQDPVTLGEVASDAAGPLLAYGPPIAAKGARAIANSSPAVQKALSTGVGAGIGRVTGQTWLGALIGRMVGDTGAVGDVASGTAKVLENADVGTLATGGVKPTTLAPHLNLSVPIQPGSLTQQQIGERVAAVQAAGGLPKPIVTPAAKPSFSAADVVKIKDLMSRGASQSMAIRILQQAKDGVTAVP